MNSSLNFDLFERHSTYNSSILRWSNSYLKRWLQRRGTSAGTDTWYYEVIRSMILSLGLGIKRELTLVCRAAKCYWIKN